MRRTIVRRAHGVLCVYLPAWLSDQYHVGEKVTFLVHGHKVTGRITRNGKKMVVILPPFLQEGDHAYLLTHGTTAHRFTRVDGC